jgi:hypothetical protein
MVLVRLGYEIILSASGVMLWGISGTVPCHK